VATIELSLPDDLKAWVETRARALGCADAGDYIRRLIESLRQREMAHDALMVEIEKGIASGVSDKTPRQIWEASRAKARAAGTARVADR
jgi:antitoxin ParD1/3/4